MKTVLFLRQARDEIDEIWTYLAARDVDAADRIVERIERATAILARHPYAGRARPGIDPEARSKPVGKFLIFYRVRGDDVEIVHVRHSARRPLTGF